MEKLIALLVALLVVGYVAAGLIGSAQCHVQGLTAQSRTWHTNPANLDFGVRCDAPTQRK